jgi:competence protein ComEC
MLLDARYPFWAVIIISLSAPAGWCLLGTSRPNRSSGPVIAALLIVGSLGVFYIASEMESAQKPEFADMPSILAGPVTSRGTVLISRKLNHGGTVLVSTPLGKCVLKFWGDPGISYRSENKGQKGEAFKPADGGLLSAGDYVAFSGFPEPLQRAKKPGGFDEFLYWKARGAGFILSSAEVQKIGVSIGFARWRTLIDARAAATLPPRTAGYLLAALTGSRDESLTSLHRSVGTSHLLAVSGAHVGIAFGIFWFFLRRFRLRLFLVSPFIWAYVFLSGAAPSALRAALMIQLVIMGRVAGRAGTGKAFNTVSAAGAVMLLCNPWLFWDVGWRLSMIAVLTLSSLTALKISPGGVFFLASPLVWLTTTLQSSLVFGSSPVVGIAANIFALPAFSVLFPLAFVCSIPALAGFPLGSATAAVPEFLFLRWERLSQNLLALCPWEISFTAPLLFAGMAAMTYLCAAASGFGAWRSFAAPAILCAGLCFLIP